MQLHHLLVVSKEDRSIPECQVYAGDGFSGSFHDCDYRHAGVIRNVHGKNPKQFNLFGIGNYLKLVFNKQPEKEGKNLGGQVALGILKVFGQPMAYY